MQVQVQNFHDESDLKTCRSDWVKSVDSNELPSLPRYNRLAKLGMKLVEF